eukprot:COSAG06_NODE_3141_length_5786_cov_31.010902_2_plen_58_part_00
MAQLTKKGRLMLCVPVDGHTDNGVTNGRARDVEQPVPGQVYDDSTAAAPFKFVLDLP